MLQSVASQRVLRDRKTELRNIDGRSNSFWGDCFGDAE